MGELKRSMEEHLAARREDWARDRNGPSMALGVFDERFKAARQAHAVV